MLLNRDAVAESTSPLHPAQHPRLDAAAADWIASVYDVRTFPLPPGDLLGEIVFENDQHGYDLFDEAAKRAVAPHWNSAVDLLRGADGYLALVRLRDRLASYVAGIVREADQRSIRASIARSVGRILAHEAERHGADTEIGTALDGWLPSGDDEWQWEPRRSQGQEEGTVVPATPPALFALRSAYLDALVAASENENRDMFVEVQRNWTWDRALSAASSTESRFSRNAFGTGTNVVDLAEFRLKVIEQVLREHELLGHVDEYGAGGGRRVALDEEQVVFVQAALSAIHAVESEVADGIASAPSWDAVRKRIGDETGWGTTRTERAATKLGAYEKHVGSGRPTADQVRSRYEQFRERVVALADPAGAGGWDESA